MANLLTVDDYHTIFVENSGLLESKLFDDAVRAAQETKRPLEQLLLERSFITSIQLLQLVGEYFKVPSTQLRVSDINREALEMVPERFASQFLAIPFERDKTTLKIALANPSNQETLHALQNSTGLEIKPYVATEHAIRRALILYDGDITEIFDKVIKGLGSGASNETFATTLVNTIIETAVLLEASDVHIEPFEDETYVRYRVDGLLRTITTMPTKLHQGITSHIKVLSGLRVDQKRLPQDGRFNVNVKGQEVNIRLSTVPSLWGEKMVLRILPKEARLFDLSNIGFLDTDLEIIKEYLKHPYGTLLVCGPTGSGKTTTLYSFLQEIGTDRIDVVNISTIEDPIEYTIPRVTQIQTHPDIELTFAAGLRALLRQDPDIIMVGEIRDQETASFAVRASLVGRMVLSSLHTNDAVGAIPRLFDMGVEPYLVSSTLILVVAQRLARKLCQHCRQSYQPTAEINKQLAGLHDLKRAMKTLESTGVVSKGSSFEKLRFFKSNGCDRCNNTGYSGRTGVFEILEVTDNLREAILKRADASLIRDIAINKDGMKTMFEDGLAKMVLGTLDLKELLRVVYN